MAAPLTVKKRDEMFQVWCRNQNISFVMEVCNVNRGTADKYRKLDHWDERLEKIRERAEEKVDETIADMLARQALQAREISEKALRYLKQGDHFENKGEAASIYFRATAEERVTRGEPADRSETLVRVRERFAERTRQREADKNADSPEEA